MLSCKCSETALFMKVAYISCSDRTTLIRTISGCFCKEQNPDHFRLQRYWIFKSGLQSVRRNRRQITHFHFQVPGQLKCFNLDSLGGWWDHQWEFSDTFIKCWNEKKKKGRKIQCRKTHFCFYEVISLQMCTSLDFSVILITDKCMQICIHLGFASRGGWWEPPDFQTCDYLHQNDCHLYTNSVTDGYLSQLPVNNTESLNVRCDRVTLQQYSVLLLW